MNHSKIKEDGNKNWKHPQTNHLAMGPTYFELWVMETENPNHPQVNNFLKVLNLSYISQTW